MQAKLFGRADEIDLVRSKLASGARLITLHGPPGVGKSRLLAQVAEGAIFVSIGAGDAIEIVARALGIAGRNEDREWLTARVAEELEARAVVLAVDDADLSAAILEAWLDAAPRATIIVTAQRLLGCAGEVAVAIAPLPVEAAIALLRDRVSRRSTRVLDDRTAETIVERLDRLPLAIELMSPRVALLGVAALRDDPALDPLRRALDAALDLPSTVASALRDAAVFHAPFDLAAARAVIDVPDVEGALVELAGRALIVPRGDRFAMLSLVRARVRSEDERRAARDRHARHFAERARATGPHAGFEERRAERDDHLAAFEHLARVDPSAAAKLAVALDPLLVTDGPPSLHRSILVRALDLAEEPFVRSELLRARGRMLGLRGEHQAATRDMEEAHRVATDDHQRGWASALLCFSLRALGRVDEARAAGERAREIASSTGDGALEAMAEQALGLASARAGDFQAALAHQRRACASARLAQAPRLVAISLANAAAANRKLGLDPSPELHEAIAIFDRIGDRFHRARIAIELARNDAHALNALLPILEEAADREGQQRRLLALADLAIAGGDARLAERHLDDAAAISRRLDDPSLAAEVEDRRKNLRRERNSEVLAVARDGRAIRLGDRVIDLGRRGAIRRVVVALVQHRLDAPGRGLSVGEVLEAGWPNERMRPESATARVYMAIRTLRTLGLEGFLITHDDGYLLDPRLAVEWF